MRGFALVVGLCIAGLAVAPQRARADVITFYGCGQTLPDACIVVTLTQSLNGGYEGTPNTGFAFPTQTPSGNWFVLQDFFLWNLPDGTCVGGYTAISFNGQTCAALNATSMIIHGQLLWEPAGSPAVGPPFMPSQLSRITFTATPEPASIPLAATGLLAVGGVGLVRRRRSRI